jgi:hypothetical protein
MNATIQKALTAPVAISEMTSATNIIPNRTIFNALLFNLSVPILTIKLTKNISNPNAVILCLENIKMIMLNSNKRFVMIFNVVMTFCLLHDNIITPLLVISYKLNRKTMQSIPEYLTKL